MDQMTFTYPPIQEKKVCVALAGFKLSARIWKCLGDTELKPSDHLDNTILVASVF